MSLQQNIGKILGGSFLGDERALKLLPFIGFITFLGLVSIKCSHSADSKVMEISRLTNQMKELEAEHIETKSRLMQLGMEGKVIEEAAALGLKESKTPPQKIVLKNE